MISVDEWLKSGKYLPRFLRDFHDQKDLFKAIHETARPDEVDALKQISWIQAQIYVIDIFLWWMARRGYTLQPAREKRDYVSLNDTIRQCKERRDAASAAALLDGLSKPKNDTEKPHERP